jgi:hypothetical protein
MMERAQSGFRANRGETEKAAGGSCGRGGCGGGGAGAQPALPPAFQPYQRDEPLAKRFRLCLPIVSVPGVTELSELSRTCPACGRAGRAPRLPAFAIESDVGHDQRARSAENAGEFRIHFQSRGRKFILLDSTWATHWSASPSDKVERMRLW